MDNEYTRKEKQCPLIGDICDCFHKDCSLCILYEDQYQEEMCKEEMTRLHTLINNKWHEM